MRKNDSTVTAQQIVEKLGINLSLYKELPKRVEFLLQHPNLFLGKDSKLKYKFEEGDFEKLERVENSEYNTGEIWEDVQNDIYFLILGKTPTEYFIIKLGGFTLAEGDIEKGTISTMDKNGTFNCNTILYTPDGVSVL